MKRTCKQTQDLDYRNLSDGVGHAQAQTRRRTGLLTKAADWRRRAPGCVAADAEDPLEQAIKFLTPLRTLAADRIDTHLMAFEIYYRKDKPLLMLQSVKRAHRLQPDHPQLRDCLLRFLERLDELRPALHQHVATVLDAETQPLFGERSATDMAQQFAAEAETRARGQAAALWGARGLTRRLPARAADALKLATSLHHDDVTIQGCVEVLEALREGEFGSCERAVEDYVAECTKKFPYAIAFKPPAPAAPPAPAKVGAYSDRRVDRTTRFDSKL
ncbi:N-alpha-acetyltransferase 15, NatA auxiliary subunit [Eumeta japonica]|uniref:N-alpha-acetyltransferase 15, NatA auxiliary subunit n=1 Tax=Eumeta variegata TaxID=151549 RepID=A0A4C1TGD6_EUMVA|nr:N-alpha-acetyltransferase 15, NatA auxiliary subunit [Eumeta japonica]